MRYLLLFLSKPYLGKSDYSSSLYCLYCLSRRNTQSDNQIYFVECLRSIYDNTNEDKLVCDYYSGNNLHKLPSDYIKDKNRVKLSLPTRLSIATRIVANKPFILLKKWMRCIKQFLVKLIISKTRDNSSLYLINGTISAIEYILSIIMKQLLYYRRYYNIVHRLFLF